MLDNAGIQKYTELENELYKKLGSNCFCFINPTSIDENFSNFAKKAQSKLQKKYKDPKTKELIDQYIQSQRAQQNLQDPYLIKFEDTNFDKLTIDFLRAQHILQQNRWISALPEYALYELEFFIPPLTEKEKIEIKLLDEELLRPDYLIALEMPYALKKTKEGLFDPSATITHEKKYDLIKSKISSMTSLEINSVFLFHKLYNFPKWAFFAINHKKQLEKIAADIYLVFHDFLMQFAMEQIEKGIPPRETRENAYERLRQININRELESIPVFRAEKTMPLENYILNLLNDLKAKENYLKPETLKDFYQHIFKSITEIIQEGKIVLGSFLKENTRPATDLEKQEIGNEYTIEIMQIADSGLIVEDIKEYYQIQLAEKAFKKLIDISTGEQKMGEYFI